MSQDTEREALIEQARKHADGLSRLAGALPTYGFNDVPVREAAKLLLELAALASQQAGEGEPYAHIVELPAGDVERDRKDAERWRTFVATWDEPFSKLCQTMQSALFKAKDRTDIVAAIDAALSHKEQP